MARTAADVPSDASLPLLASVLHAGLVLTPGHRQLARRPWPLGCGGQGSSSVSLLVPLCGLTLVAGHAPRFSLPRW